MNFETKKLTDRRCEFWLQFENGTKMFAEMLDSVPAQKDLIPQDGHSHREALLLKGADTSRKEVTINADDLTNEQSSRHVDRSVEGKSILKSALGGKRSVDSQEAGVTFDQPNDSL